MPVIPQTPENLKVGREVIEKRLRDGRRICEELSYAQVTERNKKGPSVASSFLH